MPREKVSVAPDDRPSILRERRALKMAQSAHHYVRGSTVQFYRWLESDLGKKVPQGPSIWICGDCHIGNIGPLANEKGDVEIQIRDFDQTVIGNPAHDLIRLAHSLATAARGSDLPGLTLVKMLEEMVDGYEQSLASPKAAAEIVGTDGLAPIRSVLNQSESRRWEHLAKERIKDVTPRIPLGERFWALEDRERQAIESLFRDGSVLAKVRSAKGRDSNTKVRVHDAAYWMKGCSSLGRLRYAVLLGLGKRREHDYCLIDLKEATKPAAPRDRKAGASDAERVVEGACQLSPFLGERMLPVLLLGKAVVMRELMPQDLKFDLDRLSQEEAVAAARYLAGVVGKAHGRQMDPTTKAKWRSTLRKQHSKSLEAPGWLWTSVVALIADHEVAYLEHCRTFATNK